MLTHTFVHPKEERRSGGVRISVVNKPLGKDRKYYQKRLRIELFPFRNARDSRVYLELKADDGVYLAGKIAEAVQSKEEGEHGLIRVSTGKLSVELSAVLGKDSKGLKAEVKGEQGDRSVFVPLTLTRMMILAEMMKEWCLNVVPQIEKARTLPEEEVVEEEEALEEEAGGEESVEEEE